MKNASRNKIRDKQHVFVHLTSTHNHVEDTKSVEHSHICLKSQLFVSIFTTRMVLSAQELFAIEKMAIAGMGNKKIATTLGLPQSTKNRWFDALDDDETPLRLTAPQTATTRRVMVSGTMGILDIALRGAWPEGQR